MPGSVFSRPQQKTLQALALRLFAPHEPGAFDPASLDLGAMLSEYLSDFDPLMRLGLRAMVTLVDLSPALVLGRAVTFRGLAPEDQDRVIRALSESRVAEIRMPFFALRVFLAQLFYEQDAMLRETGWGVNLARDGVGERGAR